MPGKIVAPPGLGKSRGDRHRTLDAKQHPAHRRLERLAGGQFVRVVQIEKVVEIALFDLHAAKLIDDQVGFHRRGIRLD